jgi:hypothetical protein
MTAPNFELEWPPTSHLLDLTHGHARCGRADPLNLWMVDMRLPAFVKELSSSPCGRSDSWELDGPVLPRKRTQGSPPTGFESVTSIFGGELSNLEAADAAKSGPEACRIHRRRDRRRGQRYDAWRAEMYPKELPEPCCRKSLKSAERSCFCDTDAAAETIIHLGSAIT